MQRPSRREVLAAFGMSAGSSMLAGCAGALESVSRAEEKSRSNWEYSLLDPGTVAQRAYRMYADGSCMYAVFGSIVTSLADRVGEPFASFPIGMMRYGHGGVGGWGSLCGAVNGGAAIFGLFYPEKDKKFRDGLVEELFAWYEQTELPCYRPEDAEPGEEAVRTVAGSVLCHRSVGHWACAAAADAYCEERTERCRRLSADVAAKTVEILNRLITDRTPSPSLVADVKSCLSCHGPRELADVSAKMDCRSCHTFDRPHP